MIPREIIVVDNGSSDHTAKVVAEIAGETSLPVKYTTEARPGKSRALNRGAAAAHGELLLFVDDDVIVSDGWADALVAGFDDPAVAAVAGRVIPRWPTPPPVWMGEPHAVILTLVDHGPTSRVLRASDFVGANMAIRATALDPSGGNFDTTLGPHGEVAISHEEVELVGRLALSHKLIYQPAAIAEHCILPARMTWGAMRRSYFQRGIGLERRERLQERPQPLAFSRRVVRLVRVAAAAAAARRANRRNPAPTPADAWLEFHAYMWAGKHAEAVFGRWPGLSSWVAKHGA